MGKCILCEKNCPEHFSLAWLLSWQALKQERLCRKCHEKFLPLLNETICPGCGRIMTKAELCPDCHAWQKSQGGLLKNRALYTYRTSAMKDYIERYKFQGDYHLRLAFKDEFQHYIKQHYPLKKWDLWVIPVDEETMATRGFNQVEGWLEGLNYHCDLQMKQRQGRIKQARKTRQERLRSKQPFLYRGPRVENRNILLVDDIYTTGRTLYYARQIALLQGAKHVRSITLCR
ncbi:MAG: ComF family protein [Ligilactobacillus sp.]|nr:ComF family protein [Ligilactobacillus sp.]